MLKKYKKKKGYSYSIYHYQNGDKNITHKINFFQHGYFISLHTSKNIFWAKGYYNIGERYGHWMLYHWGDYDYYFNYWL